MPRQFSFRGDRLAYSWGIVLLAAIAFGLLWAFGGDTHALIPLYSVGVFVCFTLSQIGMVRHWRSVRETGWRWRATVNALGGVLTAVVLVVVVYEKFFDGRLPRRHPRPAPRRDDAVHPPPVRAVAGRAGGRARSHRPAAASRGAGGRPDPGHEPRGRPGDQRRSLGQRRRPGRVHLRRRRGRGRRVRARFRAPDPGRPAGRRRVAVPGAGRAAAGLPRRARSRRGRRTSRRRSRSSSSPSTSPGTGGSGSSTTRRPSGCGRSCSAGRTRSSWPSRTGARTRRCSRRRSGGERSADTRHRARRDAAVVSRPPSSIRALTGRTSDAGAYRRRSPCQIPITPVFRRARRRPQRRIERCPDRPPRRRHGAPRTRLS